MASSPEASGVRGEEMTYDLQGEEEMLMEHGYAEHPEGEEEHEGYDVRAE